MSIPNSPSWMKEGDLPVAQRQAAEHTAGPWQRAATSHNDKMTLVGSNFDTSAEETKNGGMWVAQCIGPDRDANARLIAAAPDLLAALMLVDEDVRHHHRNESDDPALLRRHAIRAVRTAISKATGGEA